jgi:flagellar M-ring protein FliF
MLGLFVKFIGSPDYKQLQTGLDPAGVQKLTEQLDAQGIAHETSTDGTSVSVPAEKLAAAHMATASLGPSQSARTGFELFDKMSWGQTEFDQKVTYQRALEGELERSIATFNDVESARVHLVMPTDSVFLDRQHTAKASVILKLRRSSLSKDAVLAISRLVSGAVDQLKPEDVSIVDADSARSLGLGHDGQSGNDGAEATLAQQLITTLEPVVGLDKIRASVNVNHDEGTTDESSEKYDPSVSVLLSDQKSEDHAGGSAVPAGVPGTTSNIPTGKAKTPSTAPESTQSSITESAQYGVNKTIVHTMTPAGRIERVTAAILVDDAVVKTVQGSKVSYTRRKRTPEELNKIQQIAEAVIGYDAKRGDSISVENMSFDANAADADLAAPNWIEKSGKTLSDYSSMLRPVSLLVLFLLTYMFVLRPVQKQVMKPALPAGAQAALGNGPAVAQLTGSNAAPVDANARATQLKQQAIDSTKQKPVNSARAIQSWLREEAS